MKKSLLVISSIFVLSTKSALALVSAYVGVSGGAINGNANVSFTDLGHPIKYDTNKASGGLFGVNAGVEANLLLVKVAAEVFAEKAVNLTSSYVNPDFVSEGHHYDIDVQMKNPTFYGVKGKLMMNFIVVDPYITVGFGQERNDRYKNGFGLVGVGVQAKLASFGVYGELNYRKSLKESQGVKTQYTSAIVGLKYYFL